MMTGKERINTVLSHREADKIALDFGADRKSTRLNSSHCT
jgi:hypothetical protein